MPTPPPIRLTACLLLLAGSSGCGLVLDQDPRPDSGTAPDADAGPPPYDGPPVPMSPEECDFFVLAGATGSGESMEDPSGDLVAMADGAGNEGGGAVCVAEAATDGGCRSAAHEGVVTIRRGVTVAGGFVAEDARWTWDQGCKATVRGEAGDAASVIFAADADATSFLSFMSVRSPRDAELGVGVWVIGGGHIIRTLVTAQGTRRGSGIVATNGNSTPAHLPVDIYESAIRLTPDSPEMIGIYSEGGPVAFRHSTITVVDGGGLSGGIALQDSPGSVIGEGSTIDVGSATGNAIAIGVHGYSEGIAIEDNRRIRVADYSSALDDTGSAAIVTGTECSGDVLIEGNQSIIGGGPRGEAETDTAAGIAILGCRATIRGNRRIVGRDTAGIGRAVGVACTGECRIEDNTIVGAEAGAEATDANIGIFIYGAEADIIDNDLGGCGTGMILESGAHCVAIFAIESPRALIASNRVQAGEEGSFNAGVTLWSSTSVEVVNNVIEVPSGIGVYVQDDLHAFAGKNEALIHFNTIAHTGEGGSFAFHGLVVTGSLDPALVRVQNNLARCRPTASTSYAFVRQTQERGVFPPLSHNAIHGCPEPFLWGGVSYSVSALEAAITLDTNTIELSESPFVDDDTDFHLASDADEVINQGYRPDILSTEDDETPEDDFDGDLRLGPPDIGADEVPTE